jgi:hypothetical protein
MKQLRATSYHSRNHFYASSHAEVGDVGFVCCWETNEKAAAGPVLDGVL